MNSQEKIGRFPYKNNRTNDFGDTFRKYQEVNIKSIKRIQDGMNSQEKIGRFPYKNNRTNKKLNNQIKDLNQNKKTS